MNHSLVAVRGMPHVGVVTPRVSIPSRSEVHVPTTRLAALPLALLVLGCTGTDPVAVDRTATIVNGTAAGAGYGAVGALLFDWTHDGVLNGDDQICSGALVSPTVFITAAHCVHPDAVIPEGAQWYVSFDPDLYAGNLHLIAATGATWDPEYGGGMAALHDLAVISLPAGSTQGVTPLRLPRLRVLDELAAQNGLKDRIFVNVGYGASATRTGVPEFSYDGIRRISTSPFKALKNTWLGLQMNVRATDLGGDCYGDSGGPKLLASDPTTIYALVVTGDMNCRSTSWNWRLDTPEARGFLTGFVTLP